MTTPSLSAQADAVRIAHDHALKVAKALGMREAEAALFKARLAAALATLQAARAGAPEG